jgi:hypothetical protein
VIENVQEREKELQKWIDATPERKEKFGGVLENLKKAYELKADAERHKGYFQESLVRGAEFVGLGQRFRGITRFLERAKQDTFDLEYDKAEEFYSIAKGLFESADVEADRELFKVMLRYYVTEVPDSYYHESFINLMKKYDGDLDAIADYVYDNSVITDRERLDEFFSKPRTVSDVLNDPVIEIVNTISIRDYNRNLREVLDNANLSVGKEKTRYERAMYQMRLDKGISVYPEANSTMRITYGEVGGIEPRDAVYYDFLTTTKGILEKEDPDNYEFNLKPGYKELLLKEDWGRWGDNGILYVNFMTDNDITGGNSGSAVLNGKGELIGLAFDGNRESMAGDVYYVDGYTKCVNVDIRYVLWVVEKYGKSAHIIEELDIK